MAKYRVKEIVGTQTYIVQKQVQIKEKIENPNFLLKIIIFLGAENKNIYKWLNLTKKGNFDQCYHTKKFYTFGEAVNTVKKLKTHGEIKFHDI